MQSNQSCVESVTYLLKYNPPNSCCYISTANRTEFLSSLFLNQHGASPAVTWAEGDKMRNEQAK